MIVLITGASGYVGYSLINKAINYKYEVIAATRRPIYSTKQWLFFDISELSKLDIPSNVGAIIHLAANTSPDGPDEKNEIEAARKLISASKAIGAKFIFVSSQTAREDAPTRYGRIKWHIEQDVLAANGFVVRLGQVYGGFKKGLFGNLVDLVHRSYMLPAFLPSPLVQPIHVDDCAEGLLNLIEFNNIPPGLYKLASPIPVTFTNFLRSIARYRLRVYRLFIPVPVFIITSFAKILGDKLSVKIGIYRLTSLFDLPLMNTTSDLEVLGLKLRTLSSGMHRSGNDRRRRLIREGIALLSYLLKDKPDFRLVRRYVRMIEKLHSGTPLILPPVLLRWPASLALLDAHTGIKSSLREEFIWRIDAATLIAEASKQGADRFLGSTRYTGYLTVLIRMIVAISSEIVWRMLRFIIPSSILNPSSRKNL